MRLRGDLWQSEPKNGSRAGFLFVQGIFFLFLHNLLLCLCVFTSHFCRFGSKNGVWFFSMFVAVVLFCFGETATRAAPFNRGVAFDEWEKEPA